MRRLRYATLSLALFIASTLIAQANSESREAVIRQIDELRRLSFAASKSQDGAAFQRLVTPDFAFVHSTGDVDDTEKYFAFRERVVPEKSWEEEPPVYRVLGDIVVRTSFGGNRVPGRGDDSYRGVDVYVRQDGNWRWAFHQTTRVPRKAQTVALNAALLSEYSGVYMSDEGTKYVVSREGDGLALEGQRGRTSYRPQSESTFNAYPLPVNVVFLRDKSGRATRMEVHRRETVTVFKRVDTQ